MSILTTEYDATEYDAIVYKAIPAQKWHDIKATLFIDQLKWSHNNQYTKLFVYDKMLQTWPVIEVLCRTLKAEDVHIL